MTQAAQPAGDTVASPLGRSPVRRCRQVAQEADCSPVGRTRRTLRTRAAKLARYDPLLAGGGIEARRYRYVARALITDSGGLEQCSEARLQLIRRLAGVVVVAERLEQYIAAGDKSVDLAVYATLINSTNKLARALGINRIPKPVASLRDVIDGRATMEDLPDE